eukprot:4520860-Pleurochrysis_carterae.AAC.1
MRVARTGRQRTHTILRWRLRRWWLSGGAGSQTSRNGSSFRHGKKTAVRLTPLDAGHANGKYYARSNTAIEHARCQSAGVCASDAERCALIAARCALIHMRRCALTHMRCGASHSCRIKASQRQRGDERNAKSQGCRVHDVYAAHGMRRALSSLTRMSTTLLPLRGRVGATCTACRSSSLRKSQVTSTPSAHTDASSWWLAQHAMWVTAAACALSLPRSSHTGRPVR